MYLNDNNLARWFAYGLFALLGLIPFLVTCDAMIENEKDGKQNLEREINQSFHLADAPYSISQKGEQAALVNAAHRMDGRYDDGALLLEGRQGWSWSYRFFSFGREEQTRFLPGALPRVVKRDGAALGVLNRESELTVVEIDRQEIVEWYANGPEGIEQGFFIENAPIGEGLLVIEGAVDTGLEGREETMGTQVAFSARDRDVLRVQGLAVMDQADRFLPAWMEWDPPLLRIFVDDEEAVYPIVVDPLIAAVHEMWINRYNSAWNSQDRVVDMAVDSEGNAIVVGHIENSAGTNADFLTIKYDPAGAELWTRQWTGAQNIDRPHALALDGAGNILIGGATQLGGYMDFMTLKYDPSGTLLWSARYDGPADQHDVIEDVAVDSDGNVYVTGLSVGVGSGYDIATAKYDADGAEQWVTRWGGTAGEDDLGQAIAVDDSANVFVVGSGANTGTGLDFVTIQYDTSGVLQWVRTVDGSGNGDDQAADVAVDSDGNAYVTGGSLGDGSRDDYLTVKYDSTGAVQWSARYNGTFNLSDLAASVGLDPSGNVYVAGSTNGDPENLINPVPFDYGTVKYDANGNEQWVATYNGPASGADEAFCVAVDGGGNAYVTGTSHGATSWSDFATLRYDSDGNEEWILRYNGAGNSADEAKIVAVDSRGNVHVAGSSIGSGSVNDYLTIRYCDGCSIDGQCRLDQTVNPDNVCQICDVARSDTAWSDNDGVACEDGSWCNGDDTCGGGSCSLHAGNPCPDNAMWCDGAESCDEENDRCLSEYGPGSPRCQDDGLWCSGEEACDEPNDRCIHRNVPGCPDDGIWCNGQEYCNESEDQCDVRNVPDCSDDELWCNGEEFCDEAHDQCGHRNGPDCDDNGLYCDGQEFCNEQEDRCDVENVPDCSDDELWCNGEEFCDEAQNQCGHRNGPDCDDNGLYCDGQEFCNEQEDRCDVQNIPSCPDDGLWCNGEEFCNESADQCGRRTVPECGDNGLYCDGVEFCDEQADQCAHRQAPNCPDDGLWCNGEEFCDESADQCGHQNTPACADDGKWCNGEEFCDEDEDECGRRNQPDCSNDGLWCNGHEFCDEASDVCGHRNGPDCDEDGLWCNGEEFCDEENNECARRNPPDCSNDGLWCNGEEFCDEASDVCGHRNGPDCDEDGLWCNGEEFCDEENDACAVRNVPDCPDDELYCNGDEYCDEENDECGHGGDPCGQNETCNESEDSCDPAGDDDDDDDDDDDSTDDDSTDDDSTDDDATDDDATDDDATDDDATDDDATDDDATDDDATDDDATDDDATDDDATDDDATDDDATDDDATDDDATDDDATDDDATDDDATDDDATDDDATDDDATDDDVADDDDNNDDDLDGDREDDDSNQDDLDQAEGSGTSEDGSEKGGSCCGCA